MNLLKKALVKQKTSFSYYSMFKEELKTEVLPEIVGRIVLGTVFLVFTSPN
jgi:hypothetical protein